MLIMEKYKEKKISKFLSYVLRHKPEEIGIELDENGWVDIDVLLDKMKPRIEASFEDIQYVVDNNDKKRFSISIDSVKIRANQGHSIKVDLDLKEVSPPSILYHGTPIGSVESIMKEGLDKRSRHHVHLSFDRQTAMKVGSRRGKCEILEIDAEKLSADGHKVFISENGVYLTDKVPPKYIKLRLNKL